MVPNINKRCRKISEAVNHAGQECAIWAVEWKLFLESTPSKVIDVEKASVEVSAH